MITRARDLLYSHHRALILLRWGNPFNFSDVTVGLENMTVVVTDAKFAHVPCLLAETVHIKLGEFWQPVLASIASVQYLAAPSVFSL